MPSLFDVFKKKTEEVAQGVWRQVNPLDGGKTYSNPNPQPQAPQPVQQKIQNAKYGVLANNPQAQNNFVRDTYSKPNVRLEQIKTAATTPISTIVKPFWETGNATVAGVKALNAKRTGNQVAYNNAAKNVSQSLDQSLFGNSKRFGQSVATAALTPVMNREIDKQARYSDRVLGKALTTDPRTGRVDPRGNIIKQNGNFYYSGGQSAAEDNNLENSYRIRQEALAKSGVNMNDSLGTTARKVGAQGAGTVLDMAFSGLAAKALTNAPAKQMLKNSLEGGTYGLTGGLANAAQMDNPTKMDYLAQGGAGLAMGMGAPIALKGIGSVGSKATKPVITNLKNKGYIKPNSLTPEELLALDKTINSPNGFIDENIYRTAQQAAKKIGADLGTPDGKMKAFNAISENLHYNTQKNVRNQAFQNLKQGVVDRLKTPMNQKGFVRNPLVNPDGTPRIGKTDPLESLKQEARKYKSAEEFIKNTDYTPQTTRVYVKSKFRDGGGYADVPVIRKEKNITLYQGGTGEKRQFWTPNKDYAKKFGNGEVVKKTGTFYQVDNGNRMTAVYVDADKQLTDIYNQATAPKTVENTVKIDPEMRQVIDATQQALDEMDLDGARSLADTLPDTYRKSFIKQIDAAQSQYEQDVLRSVIEETNQFDARVGGDSNANATMSEIAKKLADHFNAPKSLYKITGFKRTYDTPSGKLQVGGDAKTALDNLIFGKDLDTFTHNIDIMADKFGGTFRVISNTLKAKAPDGADYEKFTGELYGLLKKRPNYTRGNSETIPSGIVRNINTPTKKASNRVTSDNSKQLLAGNSTKQTATKTLEKPQVGKITSRIAPQIDETMALTKTGEQGVLPPNKPPVAETPPQLGSGKTKKTRFADKTVPKSEFVTDEIKGSIKSPSFNPQTEKMGYESALNRLKKQGDKKFESDVFSSLDKKNGTISRQEAIDAQTLAALLDGGSPENIRKATQIYERLSEHYTAAGQLAQAAAIIARRSPEGLRAYAVKTFKQNGVKITPDVEKELTTLVQAVKKATPEAKPRAQWEVMNYIAKKTPTSTGDKIVNTWRAGLLTAPTTTGGNLLGNTGEAVVRKGFVNPVATAADAVMGAFTGKRSMTLGKFGEGAKGAAEGGKMLPDYMKTGYDPRNNAAKYDAPSRINTGSKALDAYINGTYRLMGVADMPFNQLAEREALSSIAKSEALNKGLRGQAQKDFVNEFMANPPETALARAQKEADYATFKNPTALGKAATGLKRPLGAVGDFIVPFTQVPASIATRIVERTPVGTANEMVKQIINVRKGGTFDQRAMAQAIGNGAFGPAIMGIGFALANNDQLTFGYPSQEKDRKLFDEQGKQPYSVRVGDRWYSLNYLQPFGTLLAIGGQAAQAKKDGKDTSAIIGQGVATAGQSVMNQSFLKGIGGALDALSDPERSVRKYVEQTTSSIVPNFIRSGARSADPIQRAPEGIVEGVKSGIPGLRDSTTPKLGMFGEPLPAKDTFWNQYANPLKPSKVRETPAVSELQRMRSVDQGVLPTEADKSVFGKDKPLDNKQLTDLNKTTGQAIKPFYEDVIKSDRYKTLSDEDKAKTLKKINDVVYGAEKISWGVKNGVIEADGKKLTKDQIAYLEGKGVDFFPKEPTTKTAKKGTTKKVSTKKTSSKKTGKVAKGKKQAMPKYKNISPSKGLVNTRVASVKFAPVKKPTYKGKKVKRNIA